MISHEYFENSLDPFEEKYHCKFSEKKHSLKGLYNESIYTKIDIEDYKVYLENMWEEINQRISEEVFPNLKYQLNLLVEFSKSTPNDAQFTTAWFNSGEFISTAKSFIDEQAYKELTDKVIVKVEKFTHQGSGWSVSKLLEFRLKIAKHIPIKGSSYLELPEKYRNPKFRLIDMKNQDEECFKWCVARHFCRDERDPQRISKRLRLEVDKLNWKGIEFPMKLNKINSFENLNTISINVYSLDNELNLYPLRISEETFDVCIHLLLIQEKEKRHYILMKDLSPFIKHDSKNKKYVCPRCLSTFNKQEKLDSHLNDCKAKKPNPCNIL